MFVCLIFFFFLFLLIGLLLPLLLEEPRHAPVDALLQRPQGHVVEDPLGLGDVVVPRHGGHGDLLGGKGGLAAEDGGEDLAQEAEDVAEAGAHGPDARGALVVAGGAEDGAGEVPEVDGAVVGDEEGLAVDALVVERGRGGRRPGGGEEALGGEEVAVGDVADVGEVEEVGVVADLDARVARLVGVVEAGEGLDVALAEDAGGSDRGGEEVRVGF